MDPRTEKCAKSGQFILGPQTRAFEKEFALFSRARAAIGVANGTDALSLALRAADIQPGDEVITSAYSFFASAETISQIGAIPVFADIDPLTFNINPDHAETLISSKTRALLPVHLFGHPADMTRLLQISKKHNLSLIEDCAQACGALWKQKPTGSFGHFGCFSFYPSKPLGGYGDGGMITVNTKKYAQTIKNLKQITNHGALRPFVHSQIGVNSRLDEIQAALLRIKLRRLPRDLLRRRAVADAYDKHLPSHLQKPARPHLGNHAFAAYTIQSPQRDLIQRRLKKEQISSAVYYPLPLHLQPVYKKLGYKKGACPHAERASANSLSLPIFPDMTHAEVMRVCRAISKT